MHSDVLIDYLQMAKVAERNHLDLTVTDLYDIKRSQKEIIFSDIKVHQQSLPQIKNFLL